MPAMLSSETSTLNAESGKNFPPYFLKFLENLCFTNRIGLSRVNIADITTVEHQDGWEDDDEDPYHFLMKIPYAGKQLTWEVLFDPTNVTFAPDFLFDDPNFPDESSYESIRRYVPSLLNWDFRDPGALYEVLSQLLDLYKMKHIRHFGNETAFKRYYDEFREIIELENGIPKENFEVFVEKTGSGRTTLTLLVSLKLDFSSLPPYYQETEEVLNPGPDFAHLKIILRSDFLGNVTVDGQSLHFSPLLHQNLGSVHHMPRFSTEDTLQEYICRTTDYIEDQIKYVTFCEQERIKFIMAVTNIASACNKDLVEYDVDRWRCAFLRGTGNFRFLVRVKAGKKFPRDKPMVTLTSLYTMRTGNRQTVDVSYDAEEDSSEEIAVKLFESVDNAIATLEQILAANVSRVVS